MVYLTVEQLENPFAQDVPEQLPRPATLVIFGATGDLTARKLLPAIYNIGLAGILPEKFRLIGVAFDSDKEGFLKAVKEALKAHSRTGFDEKTWPALSESIDFIRGDFADGALYENLKDLLDESDKSIGTQTRRLFYMATAPRFFGTIAAELGKAGLGAGAEPETRLLVEKPFGRDLASGVELNAALLAAFNDDQILRIDHYLAKETVQNLLFFRFTNGIFEPVWNRRYVDHIQITVAEELGIGERAGYYDTAGALRDVVQNHILQLVSLIGMEPPASFDAELMHNEKVKLLQAVEAPVIGDVPEISVRGQYGAGRVDAEPVVGYLEEDGIDEGSQTETYVAMKLLIDNWRWAGTPFYIRTGKRLPLRLTEIVVRFKPVPHLPIAASGALGVVPNELVFRVQPNEGASLRLVAKVPGFSATVRPVRMDFQYGASFVWESPEAYETLIHDALLDDKTRFTSTNEVEQTWRVADPLLKAWSENLDALVVYEAGTDGPSQADDLLARDGREWRKL